MAKRSEVNRELVVGYLKAKGVMESEILETQRYYATKTINANGQNNYRKKLAEALAQQTPQVE